MQKKEISYSVYEEKRRKWRDKQFKNERDAFIYGKKLGVEFSIWIMPEKSSVLSYKPGALKEITRYVNE